jgi:hypothetical protein
VLRRLFAASVPKELSAPDQNEDAFGCDDSRQLYVLSDGASESFNSWSWSRILVRVGLEFRPRSPRGYCQLLRHCINVYEDRCRAGEMSWAQEAAFARGSFATFLAVKAARGPGNVIVFGTGDTIAVLVAGGEIVFSFPYSSPEQFARRPHLLSTRVDRNRLGGIDIVAALRSLCREDPAGDLHRRWSVSERCEPRILCMTDALGAWLLEGERNGERPLEKLLEIATPAELHDLVEEEREAGRMRRDDSTLVVLGWSDAPPDA